MQPNTLTNQTARGIATLFACRRSSKSFPLTPCGMLLLSLYKGTSGFARSENQAFRFASLRVAREGTRKVVDLHRGELGEVRMRWHKSRYARYLGQILSPSLKYLVHKILQLLDKGPFLQLLNLPGLSGVRFCLRESSVWKSSVAKRSIHLDWRFEYESILDVRLGEHICVFGWSWREEVYET